METQSPAWEAAHLGLDSPRPLERQRKYNRNRERDKESTVIWCPTLRPPIRPLTQCPLQVTHTTTRYIPETPQASHPTPTPQFLPPWLLCPGLMVPLCQVNLPSQSPLISPALSMCYGAHLLCKACATHTGTPDHAPGKSKNKTCEVTIVIAPGHWSTSSSSNFLLFFLLQFLGWGDT